MCLVHEFIFSIWVYKYYLSNTNINNLPFFLENYLSEVLFDNALNKYSITKRGHNLPRGWKLLYILTVLVNNPIFWILPRHSKTFVASLTVAKQHFPFKATMSFDSSRSANSGSKSKRSLSSNPTSSNTSSKRKKTSQKTLGMAWGANSRSSSRPAFSHSPFSDFGRCSLQSNKTHLDFNFKFNHIGIGIGIY